MSDVTAIFGHNSDVEDRIRENPKEITNKLRSPESANELGRLSDRHLSTKFSVNSCG
jgi:hypothetical protein